MGILARPVLYVSEFGCKGRGPSRIAVALTVVLLLSACETAQPEPAEPTTIQPAIEPAAPRTLELVERALSEHRYGDARKLLDRVLVAEPDNAEANLLAAELILATGFPEQAAETFGKLTEISEIGARALQGHGISLMLTGKREAGFESLRLAVEKDPSLWRAWNALGYYHDYHRDWAAAVDSYGRALDANPNSALIYNNRGFSMIMQRRIEEAVADLNRALRIDPEFNVARENLRLALAWEGKYIHAMSGTPDRDMARILNNIGFIALMRGDYTNAEAYLTRAMELDPSYNDIASRNLNYLKELRELDKAGSAQATN